MSEIAGIASRIGEQGSDVRTRSKSMGYLGLIISKEQYVKITRIISNTVSAAGIIEPVFLKP